MIRLSARRTFMIALVALASIFLGFFIFNVSRGGLSNDKCQRGPGRNIDWSNCSKSQLLLADDDLTGAVLTKAVLSGTDFSRSRMAGSKLDEAELSRTRFSGADLAGSSFAKAVGWRSDFNNANLEKALFTGADMSRSTFAGAKMADASLNKAELNRSDFAGADLTGADMSKAELARTLFKGAKLSGVDFSYTNLSRADFTGMTLDGVKIKGAYLFLTRLADADLTRVTGLSAEQLELACGTSGTRLPPGIEPPASWPCDSGEDEGQASIGPK
jgi:uncharacterized protein YjbI with pentapeptide repeats